MADEQVRELGKERVIPQGYGWNSLLARDGEAYTVTDPQSGVVRRFEPRSGFYLSAAGEGELPLVSVTGSTRVGRHAAQVVAGRFGQPRPAG